MGDTEAARDARSVTDMEILPPARTSGFEPQREDMRPPRRSSVETVAALLGFMAIVAMLSVARDVFVPIALAVLLSFVLFPVIILLRKVRVPRTLAVVAVVLVALSGILSLTAVVALQVADLASELPRYQQTIREKVRTLKGATEGAGTWDRLSAMLEDLGHEFEERSPIRPEGAPLPVEIHERAPGTLGMVQTVAEPLLHPLATIGIIFIFTIFILLQREDLRNRLIRLAGAHDIQRTTAALDDAAARLSRFFLTQVMLNAAFGAVIGVGLWLIGVPSPALWGLLAAVLRFVPYVGAIIAAVLPLVLAMAVDPGWSIVIATALLFAVVEPLVGHIIEPLVYGRSTGLSPVAVVASATFWTWLWGPIGLVLSTPLTLCLVVLGRHVEQLDFLDIMLGDRPPLTAAELFYQRMLAGDPVEATTKAEEFLKEGSLADYLDEVALPGLRLAQRDAARGAIDHARMQRIEESVREMLDNLALSDDPSGGRTDDPEAEAALEAAGRVPDASPPATRGSLAKGWPSGAPVLCLAVRSPLDLAAAGLVRHLLARHGVDAQVGSAESFGTQTIPPEGPAPVVLLSSLEMRSFALLRYSARRIRRHAPHGHLVLCAWGAPANAGLRANLASLEDTDALVERMAELERLLPEQNVPSNEDEESPAPVRQERNGRSERI
ncbi:AI-2E family transporter [Aquabacter cavernae]|uniref:AI-2E family transporter n=1 Tax=Aquabacter cavernae TaxID=2496029 RepID=UPI001FE08C18|nr:AI-2E family transporter [Aquabacter cavernae]